MSEYVISQQNLIHLCISHHQTFSDSMPSSLSIKRYLKDHGRFWEQINSQRALAEYGPYSWPQPEADSSGRGSAEVRQGSHSSRFMPVDGDINIDPKSLIIHRIVTESLLSCRIYRLKKECWKHLYLNSDSRTLLHNYIHISRNLQHTCMTLGLAARDPFQPCPWYLLSTTVRSRKGLSTILLPMWVLTAGEKKCFR